MYESYAWPGANSLRAEIKMIAKKFKQFINVAIKKIDEKEKNLK